MLVLSRIICPPVPGHLNPILALGRELQMRGYLITLINFLDTEIAPLKAGVEFQAIAATLISVSKPLFAIALIHYEEPSWHSDDELSCCCG